MEQVPRSDPAYIISNNRLPIAVITIGYRIMRIVSESEAFKYITWEHSTIGVS